MEFKKQKHLLAKRKAANAFRVLRPKENLEDFCSNDYLGIAKSGEGVAEKVIKGSGGSRLLAGNYPEIESLEKYIANFHQSEEALIFNSGYNANVGVFSSIPQKGDTILYDELIHASIKEGVRLCFAKSYSFKHNDVLDLEQKLDRAEGDIYIVVESVYSMDGDSAPIEKIIALKQKKSFCFVVDEAHSVGVFGNRGEGLVEKLEVSKGVDIRIVTFGKALGTHGAAVLSQTLIKDFLINFSRSFIYTTALPPYSIQSIQSSYEAISNGELTVDLRKKIQYFKNEAKHIGLSELIESSSAIQCVLVPGNVNVKRVADALIQSGFDVRPVMSPTVPLGQERLRICLHVFNDDKSISSLIKKIKSEIIAIGN